MGVNRGLFWRVSMVTMGLLECTCHVLHDVPHYLHCLVRDSTPQKSSPPPFFVVYRGLCVSLHLLVRDSCTALCTQYSDCIHSPPHTRCIYTCVWAAYTAHTRSIYTTKCTLRIVESRARRCEPRTEEIALDIIIIWLPKLPTSFHENPRTYQTHFLGGLQNFQQGFTWGNRVPVTQRIYPKIEQIWKSKYFKSDLLREL